MRNPQRNQRGSALLLALVAVVVVALAVSLTAGFLQNRTRTLTRDIRSVELTALADAAMAEALARLAENSAFSGVDRHAFGSGEIGSSVTGLSAGMVQVRATGASGEWRVSIVAEVRTNGVLGPRVLRWRYSHGKS